MKNLYTLKIDVFFSKVGYCISAIVDHQFLVLKAQINCLKSVLKKLKQPFYKV